MTCVYCNICNIWFLDAEFPNRWIGRDGPTPWPPRSPDITPLDFFLWRYVKDKVFSTPVPDITNLKARITDAFATVTEDSWREIDYRLDVLRATSNLNNPVHCQHLAASYNDGGIGQGGPIAWSPRSPDLTPIYFFVWGKIKTLIETSPVDSERHLFARIVEAATTIWQQPDIF